ncbi:MAG TPA: ArsI/CadI family heavy metal resistance metalloenzyme [Candidatus Cybelea sp.]
MKTHLNFATTDLARSVEFYSTLLNARPKKLLADYALFITDWPGLELALDAVDSAPQLSGDHYGVFVETVEEVERAAARLEEAGLASSVQREQTCCYASQTKVWATDPAGRRWEVYTVHQESAERESSDSTCCADPVDADVGCCTHSGADVEPRLR